jgi:hypothetical protein
MFTMLEHFILKYFTGFQEINNNDNNINNINNIYLLAESRG